MHTKHNMLVESLAKSSGVAEADVAKILGELGLSRNYAEAVRLNNGQELDKSAVRIAFRTGRTLIVM